MAFATNTPCRTLPSEGAPARHQLMKLFWMVGPAFIRWTESIIEKDGATPKRMYLMGLLYAYGPMMMSSLKDRLGVTATNVTALLNALEKDGSCEGCLIRRTGGRRSSNSPRKRTNFSRTAAPRSRIGCRSCFRSSRRLRRRSDWLSSCASGGSLSGERSSRRSLERSTPRCREAWSRAPLIPLWGNGSVHV